MDRKEQAEIFLELFTGNTRSFGQYRPKGEPPMWTIKGEECTLKHALDHFDGKVGLGKVPIMDDGNCWWGGIDIDAHGDAPDVDLKKIAVDIDRNELPLIPCRSKSGGAHLYLFLLVPQPAEKVQQVLKMWAEMLGWPGVEIFPKQKSLSSNTGNLPLGNWLNLPYFNIKNTDRYLLKYGKPVGLDTFIKTAMEKRASPEALLISEKSDHSEAPPCVQQLIKGYAKAGTRNEALYALTVYMQRKSPESFQEDATKIAESMFDPPLPPAEVSRTIQSVKGGSYTYKCGQSPCQDFCNRRLCYTRKYGIEPRDSEGQPVGESFNNLRRYNSDPVVWELDVLGHSIRVGSSELIDMRLFRRAVLESAAILLPPMKAPEWEAALNNMMGNIQIFAVPDDASPAGRVRVKLLEFVRRCDLTLPGKLRDLSYGNPVVTNIDGNRVVAFRGIDFVEYLRNTRTDELKQAMVWMAVKSLGVQHSSIPIGKSTVEVWYLDIDIEVQDVAIEVPDYDPEY